MITSTSNKKVKQIAEWQSKARERRRDRIFLVEGFKMFEEAPAELVREVYLTREAYAELQRRDTRWALARLEELGYEMVSEEVMTKISDTQTPQGILAVLDRPRFQLEELLQGSGLLFLLLENLQDPGNLGTILRTAEGAGVTAVIMTRQTVDIYNPKTIRSTMGSIYRVPHLYVDSLPETIALLGQHGVRTYAAHLAGKTYYDSVSFRDSTAFLLGNEGNGLTKEAAALADRYIRIPMEGRVESLNVAVAAALLTYEAHRQRRQ